MHIHLVHLLQCQCHGGRSSNCVNNPVQARRLVGRWGGSGNNEGGTNQRGRGLPWGLGERCKLPQTPAALQLLQC